MTEVKKFYFRIVVPQPNLITTAHINPVGVPPDVPVRIPPTVPATMARAALVGVPPTVPVRSPPIGPAQTHHTVPVRSPPSIPPHVQVRSPHSTPPCVEVGNPPHILPRLQVGSPIIVMIIIIQNMIIIASNIKLNPILRHRFYHIISAVVNKIIIESY